LREGVEVRGSYWLQELSPDANTGIALPQLLVSNEGGGFISLGSGRLLEIPLFADSLEIENIFLEEHDHRLRKEIYLEAIPAGGLTFAWQGVWRGSLFYDTVFNPNTEVFLQVNGHDYDVTEQYSSLPEHVSGWLEVVVEREHLVKGMNKLELVAQTSGGIPENVGMVMAKGFSKGSSKMFDGSQLVPLDGELLLYRKQANSIFFSGLFRLGFLLKLVAVLLLFIAVFGLSFARFAVSQLRKEIIFSTVAAAIIYWFGLVVEESNVLLAESTTFFVYFLLRVSGFTASFVLQGPNLVVQMNQFAVRVSEASAGANNVIYFLVAFSVLLLLNWKHLNLKKALLMYIPGAFGAFLVNVLRLYIIMLLGAFVSADMAKMLNEATGLIVFVAYFVLFWYLTLGFMEKRVKELREKLRIRR